MRHGFIRGITARTGLNYKMVVDPNGRRKREFIGNVIVYTGLDSWCKVFSPMERRGKLERVCYSEMSPAERKLIRALENGKHLVFPLARFRTINTRPWMWNRELGTDEQVRNEDFGATNVFLYLGDDHRLAIRRKNPRAGVERGRKIMNQRHEAAIKANWYKTLY